MASTYTNPATGDGGARQEGSTSGEVPANNSQIAEPRQDRRLALLAVRARDLRDKVMARRIGFADAVDLCYSAAVWSGLVADVGDDVVQYVLSIAFMDVPMEARQ